MNDTNDEQQHRNGGTAEKLWNKTRKTFQTASFEATRYKRMVQKKIDLAALHRKISEAHGDLGKVIDDLRGTDETEIMKSEAVQEILRRLDGFRNTAAVLEEEIETIREQSPPTEEAEAPAAGEQSPPEPPKAEEKEKNG